MSAPYNTGNPVGEFGSDDPRDLHDNAQNLDKFINELAPTWKDRLGRTRVALNGAEGAIQQAAAQADRAENEADRAELNADIAAAAVSGSINTFWAPTKRIGDTLAASLGDGATVIVEKDESRAGIFARYSVLSGALVFVSEIDATQIKLGSSNVAAEIGRRVIFVNSLDDLTDPVETDQHVSTLDGMYYFDGDEFVKIEGDTTDTVLNKSAVPGLTLSAALENAVSQQLLGEFDIEDVTNASIILSAIPQNFQHLVIRYRVRLGTSESVHPFRLRFNTTATSDTNPHRLHTDTDSAVASVVSSTTGSSLSMLATVPAANSTAGMFASGELTLFDYTKEAKTQFYGKGGSFVHSRQTVGHNNVETNIHALVFWLGGASVTTEREDWAVGSRIEVWGLRGNGNTADNWSIA